MAQTPSVAQAVATSSLDAPSHNDGEQHQAQQSQTPAYVEVDDNPRNPKRRRISPDSSPADVNHKAEVSEPAKSSEVATLSPVGYPAQNTPVENPSKQPVQDVARPSKGQDEQQSTHSPIQAQAQHAARPVIPPPAPAQNSAPKPLARPPPTQNNPLEHLSGLDQQASQILTFLSQLTPTNAMGLSNNPGAPSSRHYASLRAAFDRTRRLISPGWPFLPQHDLGLQNGGQIEIVRKANQAIFMSSIFTGEIGLRDMDRSFLAVFIPENGKLLKSQGSMYLELKTQGFITAWRTGAAPPDLVMQDMFGPDLDKALLARRPGSTVLDPVEQEFLRSLASRRGILESAVKTKTLEQLPLRYKWEDFSREVSSYLITHIEKTSADVAGATGQTNNVITSQSGGGMPLPHALAPPVKEDFVALAARAADIALRSTLGLSFTDKLPDMPSPDTATSPSTTNPQHINSSAQLATPGHKPSELSKEAVSSTSDAARASDEEVAATKGNSHISQTALMEDEKEAGHSSKDELTSKTATPSAPTTLVATDGQDPFSATGVVQDPASIESKNPPSDLVEVAATTAPAWFVDCS